MKTFYHGKKVRVKPLSFFEEYFKDKPYFQGNFGNNWKRHCDKESIITNGIDDNWRLELDKELVFWHDVMLEPID